MPVILLARFSYCSHFFDLCESTKNAVNCNWMKSSRMCYKLVSITDLKSTPAQVAQLYALDKKSVNETTVTVINGFLQCKKYL